MRISHSNWLPTHFPLRQLSRKPVPSTGLLSHAVQQVYFAWFSLQHSLKRLLLHITLFHSLPSSGRYDNAADIASRGYDAAASTGDAAATKAQQAKDQAAQQVRTHERITLANVRVHCTL